MVTSMPELDPEVLANLPEECEFCSNTVLLNILMAHPKETKDPSRYELKEYREKERYIACTPCTLSLVTTSLSPKQLLKAKDSGGDPERFYLHQSFYDPDTGKAHQPRLPDRTRFPR